MTISVFDLFSVGIGPSSSHTVGPMLAAREFSTKAAERITPTCQLIVELYGSLALTGVGHGTDNALLMGLEGEHPATIDPESIGLRCETIHQQHSLRLAGTHPVRFNPSQHLLWHQAESLPLHSNGMRFTLLGEDESILLTQIYYSIGGGFIATDDELMHPPATTHTLPYPFETGQQLFEHCHTQQMSIAQIMMANEASWRPQDEVHQQCLDIAHIMEQCIHTGCNTAGTLPGGLNVKRRANELYHQLFEKDKSNAHHTDVLNWINLYAIAVNEQNAAGGRIVTAPTNGAAGIIPAVLQYYKEFCDNSTEQGIVDFILTAGAIAILYKKQASISGAEMGCQGEVGVACSMAAAALTAVQNGSISQIENAAEIAMEHNLGLTCDPVNGLVQIPCIERNAMGAVKAINATALALAEQGCNIVSLDKVIATMRETGLNMNSIYKETSLGGLAVNVPEC